MAENNIDLHDLGKNKGERSTNEASFEKKSMKDHHQEVSPKEAVTELGHSVGVDLDTESNMINLKPPEEPKTFETIEGAQEPEPCEVSEATQHTIPSQVNEASQVSEPSQIIEIAENTKKEEKGLGRDFDLNQEETCVGSASTPVIAKVLFDLNVVDIENSENQISAPFDLEESPTEVNQSINGRVIIDLNHCQDEGDGLACDLYHCIPSFPASSPPSSSSSSVPQPFIEEDHFDKNGTKVQQVHNYSALHDAAPDDSVFRIMGTEVMISPESKECGVPKTLASVTKGKTPLLFGFHLDGAAMRETYSQPVVDVPDLLSLLESSSSGGSKRNEPEGGLESYINAKWMANCSSSKISGKRKEPEGAQEPYEARTKKTCSS